MMKTATEIIAPLLNDLGDGFVADVAPDGTPVLSTPLRFANGDRIELAVWEEEGLLRVSDRGGLSASLMLRGVEMIEATPQRSRLLALLDDRNAQLRGTSVVGRATPDNIGAGVRDLLQTLLDGQVVAHEGDLGHVPTEPRLYAEVREVLDSAGARYRENMRVTGGTGRRYPVDFQLAFRSDDVTRAVLVVVTDRTLEMAERWNFRFRDIGRVRPLLKCLFAVSDDAPWTHAAQMTIAEVSDAVFAPGEIGALGDYLTR